MTPQMTTPESNATEKVAAVAAQGGHGTPEKSPARKAASQKNGLPKAKRTANGAKAKAAVKTSKKGAKPTHKSAARRPEIKGAKILEMIARAKGATLAEIMKATDWQAHSVRGFISIAAKKHAIKIESVKTEGGERVYRISK
jgi:hypothetical protein